MEFDWSVGLASLLAALAVPFLLLGDRSFRSTRSHAGRAVAVATGIFGMTLLALIVPVLAWKLFGAAVLAVWRWLPSS